MPEFKLHFHCQNCGDGSATVRFHKTEEDAVAADESQPEGWGESSVSSVRLKIKDGQIYFLQKEYPKKAWVPVEAK